MKILSIISQKGGVGKTTLATALAVAGNLDGKNTAILDLDPQASASFWKDTRSLETPAVAAIPSARLSHTLRVAEDGGCDLAIIDAPPFSKDIAFEAAEQANFVLIPTKPAVLDLMSVTHTLDILRHYEKPATVVLTFCPPTGREVGDTIQAVERLGAIVCPVRVHNRIAYSRAQQTGLTAQEFEASGKASKEISDLYDYICIHVLGTTRSKRHGKEFAASGS